MNNEKIRVGLIAPSIDCGGAERWMLDLVKNTIKSFNWVICVISHPLFNSSMLLEMSTYVPTYLCNRLYYKNLIIDFDLAYAINKITSKTDIIIGWEFDDSTLRFLSNKDLKIINVAHRKDN
jgi:hypothetical protein